MVQYFQNKFKHQRSSTDFGMYKREDITLFTKSMHIMKIMRKEWRAYKAAEKKIYNRSFFIYQFTIHLIILFRWKS